MGFCCVCGRVLCLWLYSFGVVSAGRHVGLQLTCAVDFLAVLFCICFTILYGVLVLFYFLMFELYLTNVEDNIAAYIFFAVGFVAAAALALTVHWGNEERAMREKAEAEELARREAAYVSVPRVVIAHVCVGVLAKQAFAHRRGLWALCRLAAAAE